MAAGKASLQFPSGSSLMRCGTTRKLPCRSRVPTWESDLAQTRPVLLELAIVESRLAKFGMPSSKLPRLLWSTIGSFSQQLCKRYFPTHSYDTYLPFHQLTLAKSIGCVNVCPTNNPDPSQPDNPGLMQSDGGVTFVGNSASTSSQQSSITQMVIDGTQGTALGDGLVQCINQYGNIYEVSRLLKIKPYRC